MYRILGTHAEVRERRAQLRHPVYQKPELLAEGPNQVWSWDITKRMGRAGGKKGKPLSNMAMLAVLKRMGRNDLTAHGFRSTFRDWAAERTTFPREVVEMALAHTIENKVEAAYRRGDLFQKRRQLMEAWARFLFDRECPGRCRPDQRPRIGKSSRAVSFGRIDERREIRIAFVHSPRLNPKHHN